MLLAYRYVNTVFLSPVFAFTRFLRRCWGMCRSVIIPYHSGGEKEVLLQISGTLQYYFSHYLCSCRLNNDMFTLLRKETFMQATIWQRQTPHICGRATHH